MSSVGVAGEVISSCFEWKIPDFFSHITAVKVNQYINSPSFSYMNCGLKLRLYPKGLNQSGWMSLVLEQEKVDLSVDTLNFSLSVKKSDGTLERKVYSAYNKWNLRKSTAWVYMEFLEEEELHQQKSKLAPSDTITIVCRMGDAENTEEVALCCDGKILEKASAESVGVFTVEDN